MRVGQILRQFVVPHLQSIHSKRRQAVVDVVEALVVANRLTGATIGRAITGPVAPKHNIKKVDRLLGNPRLQDEMIVLFRAIARVVLRGSSPVVLVDWVRFNDDFSGLCAAIPIGGRALPLYFQVFPTQDWHKPEAHTVFLDGLTQVLPKHCRPTVVTDAGFRVTWFQSLAQRGWNFVGQLQPFTKITPADTAAWAAVSVLREQAKVGKSTSLGVRLVSKRWHLPAHIVLVKERSKGRKGPPDHKRFSVKRSARRKATHPWVLASSLHRTSAVTISKIYKSRMQIEETFRDAKSHRFGWSLEDVRCTTLRRWQTTVMIASLAMLVVNLLGIIAEQLGLQRRFQANTVRHRRALSTFTLGKLLLQHAAHQANSLRLASAIKRLTTADYA